MKGLIHALVSVGITASPVFPAGAARMLTSTVVVHILSVSEEYVDRTPLGGTQILETTGSVARAQVRSIVQTDYGIAAGDIVLFRFKIRASSPVPYGYNHVKQLKPGEDATVTLWKSVNGYQWGL